MGDWQTAGGNLFLERVGSLMSCFVFDFGSEERANNNQKQKRIGDRS